MPASSAQASELSDLGWRHLWMNFTVIPGDDRPLRILRSGSGCYVEDVAGERFLDGLSGMFCVNAGHGRTRIAAVAARQTAALGYAPAWSGAHEPAIRLAAKLAELSHGLLTRVFFTSGGSEAVESAIKLARNYHMARGDERRTKIIARQRAYHGTTLGALRATGIEDMRQNFEPLLGDGAFHVPTTDRYRSPVGADPLAAADAIEEVIVREGADTVSAVILEPVQNQGGCLVPPAGYFERVREICDRHGVLLISDEVIAAWGRIGEFFGHQRIGYAPDLVTTAKGITSAYAPLGAVLATEKIAAPFLGTGTMYAHGFTFGGHPVATAVALENIAIMEEEDLPGRVREKSPLLRGALESLLDIPIVGDVRGDGYLFAIELVRDQATKERFTRDEALEYGKRVLPEALASRGVLTRVDTRTGTPIVTLAPPLIAGEEQFAELVAALRPALEEIAVRIGTH